MGSVLVVYGLSCPVACGILVPQPGVKPVSPTLAGGFFATGLPREIPLIIFFFNIYLATPGLSCSMQDL